MLTVLAQSPLERDPVSSSLALTAEAARQSGLRVVTLPPHLSEDVLSSLRPVGLAAFSGYRPSPDAYRRLHALGPLLNTPAQSTQAMEFDRYYPLVEDLTALSRVVHSEDEAAAAAEELGLPLFMKGLVKSDKEQGLAACLAYSSDDLSRRLSRGPVVARQLLPLRRLDEARAFPRTREYRAYLYSGHLLGYGYYWRGLDPFGRLTTADEEAVLSLAAQVAARLPAPLLAIDFGQLESGEWVLVEVGDPQFSGVAHMPRHRYWERLTELTGA